MIFIPAYVIAFLWINYEFERAKGHDYKYKSYTEFYEGEKGAYGGPVTVGLTSGENFSIVNFRGESKKFITIEDRHDHMILIPKDKILFMREN